MYYEEKNMAGPSSAPTSLVPPSEQAVNKKLNDDYTDPTTNEGNLLSLITLKNILGDEAGVNSTLKDMAKEETRHLMLAMKILTSKGDQGDPATGQAVQKLQEKYGRDMAGAVKLGKLLKTKADEKEVELLLAPFVIDTIKGKSAQRQVRGGFSLTKSGLDPGREGVGAAFTASKTGGIFG